MLRRSRALAAHEFRIAFADPGTLIFLIVMPVLMMAFMKPLFRLSLQAEGVAGANGAEQAVPGMAVMFAAFGAGYAGFSFFREHGWNTWERLRASAASPLEIVGGKLVTPLFVTLAQLLVLFVLGVWLFGLAVPGSPLGLALVSLTLALSLVAFGIAITAVSSTMQQLNVFANVGAILFATLGGALTPLSVMPGWVEAIAPATPTFWAMEGYQSVILDGAGLWDVVPDSLALLGFTALFALLAVTRFRFDETKVYYG